MLKRYLALALASIMLMGNCLAVERVPEDMVSSKYAGEDLLTLIEYDLESGVETIIGSVPESRAVQTEISPYIPDGLEVIPPDSLPTPASIIGDDNTTQITNVDAYPYCAIVRLTITLQDNRVTYGTGALVGKNLVLTAGHCVYSEENGWVKSITVKPGGVNSKFSATTTSKIYSVGGWVDNNNWEYDYGILKLSTNVGEETGTFGLASRTNAQLSNQSAYVYGYPCDKGTAGTLWYDTGTISSVSTRRFYYDADTYPCQSGGPVVLASNYKMIVGIHTNGFNSSSLIKKNSATRIISDIITYVTGFE